ncbi:hypothetical protein [Gluconobacter sp. P1C6_b]|uniref:hypothetical protein n=1 Tax=Gluconobacter sp. P1C6_b TaxID=2762619 RepID=UPI001C0425B1|nr:hypothetical protein [Gluconobacter sp. P1C6_b]
MTSSNSAFFSDVEYDARSSRTFGPTQIDQAETERLTALVERPELIQTMPDCADALNFLEAKIASIEGQLETSRIAAAQRGASDHYLDWHIRAHHALTVSQLQHRRVLKRRGVLNYIEAENRKQDRACDIEEQKRLRGEAAARRAEAAAQNARTQLQIVSVAAERTVHRRVCQLVLQRFGEEVHRELFDQARLLVQTGHGAEAAEA